MGSRCGNVVKQYTARAIGSNRHVLPIGVDELPVVVTIEVMARECRAAQAHFRIYAEQGPRKIPEWNRPSLSGAEFRNWEHGREYLCDFL